MKEYRNKHIRCNLKSSVWIGVVKAKVAISMPAQLMQAANSSDITIGKNGYLVIFVTNEMERKRNSLNPLKNIKQAFGQSKGAISCSNPSTKVPLWGGGGPSPTGLEMFALSSSAGNGHVRNRYTYQGQERGSTVGSPLEGGWGAMSLKQGIMTRRLAGGWCLTRLISLQALMWVWAMSG